MRSWMLLLTGLFACASASSPAPKPTPKPDWVGRPSGFSGARNEYLEGIASGQQAQAQAHSAAKQALNEQLDQYAKKLLDIMKKNPPTVPPKDAPKAQAAAEAAWKALFDSMRQRVQVVEDWKAPDGTYHALARLNLTELMLVVGSSRTWNATIKQGLMGALSQTIEPPAWVKRGSGRFEGALFGVGAASTEKIKNFSLCWETADNRARAELAAQLKSVGEANGSAKTKIQGAQIVDHWLNKDGVLFALARLKTEPG